MNAERKQIKSIMILGTASNVGKSIVATGLCRILYQDGFSVAPFKAKNIGLNSGVSEDGGEIGRGQIVQAIAAGVKPTVDMQPILVKPDGKVGGELIVRGKVATEELKQQYYKDRLWSIATESFDIIASQYEVVIMEGAGSPAEPNLMDTDIANVRMAKYAKAPIILVGDIDPGGVFASLEGTVNIIRRKDPKAGELIKGLIINKFRGERKYLESVLQELIEVTGVPILGVIPFMEDHGIPDEDTYKLSRKNTLKENAVLDAVVLRTPSLQNSDEFDPLVRTPGVQVRFIDRQEEFGNPDLVLLGGSKSTVSDLTWLRVKGLADLVTKHALDGKAVIGICGGFQMLGKVILDPEGVESGQAEVRGLDLLPVITKFEKGKEKITQQTMSRITRDYGLLQGAKDMSITGYEIHMATTEMIDGSPIETISLSVDKAVIGTYYHGILQNQGPRRIILENIARQKGVVLPLEENMKAGEEYNHLADIVRKNVDMELLAKIIGINLNNLTPLARFMQTDRYWIMFG